MTEIGIHANMSDQATSHVVQVLHAPFKRLSKSLQGDYGGSVEHLWIDLELIASHARGDGRPLWPFRLQKRVSGRGHFGLLPSPDCFNVAHYSVRPDFTLIASLPSEKVVRYALGLIYESTATLLEKQKKLVGFDAALFRSRFLDVCRSLGYGIEEGAL